MEITTCEQYVLAELDRAHEEIELLSRRNEELQERNELLAASLKESLEREADSLYGSVVRTGRRKLFNEGCSTYTDVTDGDEVRSFEDWRSEATSKYNIPNGWKRQQFMDYFEPEYRALYEKKVAALSEDDGEGE